MFDVSKGAVHGTGTVACQVPNGRVWAFKSLFPFTEKQRAKRESRVKTVQFAWLCILKK